VMNGHTPNVSVDSQISHLSHYHKNGDRKTMFKVNLHSGNKSKRKDYHNVATQRIVEDQQRRDYYGAPKQKGYYEVVERSRLDEDTDDSTDSEAPRYQGRDQQFHSANRPRNRDDSVFLPVTEPQHEKQKTRSTNKSNSTQTASTKSHGRKPAVFVHMQ